MSQIRPNWPASSRMHRFRTGIGPDAPEVGTGQGRPNQPISAMFPSPKRISTLERFCRRRLKAREAATPGPPRGASHAAPNLWDTAPELSHRSSAPPPARRLAITAQRATTGARRGARASPIRDATVLRRPLGTRRTSAVRRRAWPRRSSGEGLGAGRGGGGAQERPGAGAFRSFASRAVGCAHDARPRAKIDSPAPRLPQANFLMPMCRRSAASSPPTSLLLSLVL